jgi:hypothetical protein
MPTEKVWLRLLTIINMMPALRASQREGQKSRAFKIG